MTESIKEHAGTKNLIPFDKLPEEEQKRIRSLGGKASQAKQRRRRTQAEIIRQVMALEVEPGAARDLLAAAGLETDWITDANVALMRRARSGDVESLRYIRDTVGEKPREGLEIGNLDGQPLTTLDLGTLTDDQLKALVAAREAAGSTPDEV